jgi:hypothetical protein
MTRPPSAGPHAGYRPLPTPGPLGCNDHGDPYWRRRDRSPGPLGHNDHGAPLIARLRLLAALPDYDMTEAINHVIAAVNETAPAAAIVEKLRSCIEATRRDRGLDPAQDARAQTIETYFNARLLACEGQRSRADQEWAALPPGRSRSGSAERAAIGGVYRSSAPSDDKSPSTAVRLSHRRIGYDASGDPRPGAFDPARAWAEKGSADGLRDRSAGDQQLQPHA